MFAILVLPLSDHEKTFVYHNTFWGGNDSNAVLVLSRYARTFRKVMPFYVINNIFKDHPWYVTKSHEVTGPNLLYAFVEQNKPRRDADILKQNKVLGVKESEKIWNQNGMPGLPDLSLASDSPALNAAVDVSKPFTVNGKTFPALPGFKSGYFKGKAPAYGALQSGEDMTFFNERFVKALDAMKMLAGYGIKMPVPQIR